MLKFASKATLLTLLALVLLAPQAEAQISGIRITQTGNTGLEINVDVTAFYTTGSTTSEAYLGTYYNAVPAIDWGDGSTTPRYGYGPSTGLPLAATSTVVNGIPARSYRGSFAHTYGSAGTYTIAANTRCCPITTPTYTLVSGTILTTTITTTGVFGPTTFTTSFVQNTLGVTAELPGFSKAFAPDTVAVGVPSTLTFTIDNANNTLDDNNLDFTDNLPAGVVVASPANVVNTCTGGTVTATSGTGVISYTGGLVTAGATCTISADVVSGLPGGYVNTTGDLTSGFGNSGTANDTLNVTAVPPTFSKSFAPNPTSVGVPSTLTFTIDNSANAAAAPALDFNDDLPAGLEVASPANTANTCTGGTLTATSGTAVISYTGGSAAAASTCTISVDVVANLPGDYANTTDDLTSSFGNSSTASDTLTVTAVAPTFTKTFVPDITGLDLPSALTFTIDNSANAAAAPAIDFTDNLPNGLVISTPANTTNTCTGGTLTATDGTSSINYTGGSVAANGTCTITVDVQSDTSGIYSNTTGDLTSSFGNSGTASDDLNVSGAPVFLKEFFPATIAPGGISTLTFTIDNNANNVAAMDLAFTDNLPTGMEVADPANPNNTCTGGTLTANPGDVVITYADGTVAANATCTVSVDITVTEIGNFENIAEDLSSNLGSSAAGSAVATLSGGSVLDIPTLSTVGLVALSVLIGFMALVLIRRRL